MAKFRGRNRYEKNQLRNPIWELLQAAQELPTAQEAEGIGGAKPQNDIQGGNQHELKAGRGCCTVREKKGEQPWG